MHKRMSPHGDYDHMVEAINIVNNFKEEKVIFNCGEFNHHEQDLIKVLDETCDILNIGVDFDEILRK